jgi:hypothetical protein
MLEAGHALLTESGISARNILQPKILAERLSTCSEVEPKTVYRGKAHESDALCHGNFMPALLEFPPRNVCVHKAKREIGQLQTLGLSYKIKTSALGNPAVGRCKKPSSERIDPFKERYVAF